MPLRQKLFAVLISLVLLVVIVDFVRRKKLREEYSWLWLLTGATILVLALWYDLLVGITSLIGAVLPTSTLFFFGLVFLLFISLHFCLQISALTDHVKDLTQELALLQERLERGEAGDGPPRSDQETEVGPPETG